MLWRSFIGSSTRERYSELFSDSPYSYTSDASKHQSFTPTHGFSSDDASRVTQPSRLNDASTDSGWSSFPAN